MVDEILKLRIRSWKFYHLRY